MMKKRRIIFTGILICILALPIYLKKVVYAQTGCDFTVGAGHTFTDIGVAGTQASDVLDQSGVNWAGKTICVRNNKEYDRSNFDKSGASAAPLIIKSHPDNNSKPKFRDNNEYPSIESNEFIPVIAIRGSNVLIKDLEVSRSSSMGIGVNQSSNVTLEGVVVHDTFNHGIRAVQSNGLKIKRATLFRTTMKGTLTNCIQISGCTIPEVIMIKDSNNVLVEDSLVYDDGSPGKGGVLTAYRADGVTFQNNEVYHVQGNSMHIDNADHVLFENNFVYETCDSETLGIGLYKLSERGEDQASWTYLGSHITIRNNVIVGKLNGINIGSCQEMKAGEQCPLQDVVIENNTILGASEYALRLTNHDPASNIIVRNNIFHDNNAANSDGINQLPSSSVTFSGNTWSKRPDFAPQDIELADISSLFIYLGSPLSACINGRSDVSNYELRSVNSTRGANALLAGIRTSTNNDDSGSTNTTQGDFTNDQQVNFADYQQVISGFGNNYDIYDFNAVITNYQ